MEIETTLYKKDIRREVKFSMLVIRHYGLVRLKTFKID